MQKSSPPPVTWKMPVHKSSPPHATRKMPVRKFSPPHATWKMPGHKSGPHLSSWQIHIHKFGPAPAKCFRPGRIFSTSTRTVPRLRRAEQKEPTFSDLQMGRCSRRHPNNAKDSRRVPSCRRENEDMKAWCRLRMHAAQRKCPVQIMHDQGLPLVECVC